MPIVTLDEVRDEINTTSTADDTELQGFLDAAQAVVEEIVGPVASVALDEFYDGGQPTILLRSYPVLTVTAVTEYTPDAVVLAAEPYGTTTFTDTAYRMNAEAGVLTRTSGGWPRPFRTGTGNVRVQYTAGRATVPPNIRNGMLELIRMQWQPQQSGNLPGVTTDDFGGVNVMGFFVPNRVMELLSPSQRAPRVA